jgi:hypothetical protein
MNALTPRSVYRGGADANVKADKRCTANPSPGRITSEHPSFARLIASGRHMRWAKLVLYLYVAQAAAGTAIGFALPFLSLG